MAGDPTVIELSTLGMAAKWGFQDGDVFGNDTRVQTLLRRVHRDTGLRVSDRDLLVAVVRQLVVPQLDQLVEIDEIVTLHNPARATCVDGVLLDSYGLSVEDGEPVGITPDVVEVPPERIRMVAMELANHAR